jgi:hypothetical protein
MYIYKLNAQRAVILQQIGKWPVRKHDVIITYLKQFSAFVNSIDFDAIPNLTERIIYSV